MRRHQLWLGILCALCVWGTAGLAEASHYEGGDITYDNLGPLGGASAQATWIHIRATMTIRQRGSAHCATNPSQYPGGAAIVAPHNQTCCNSSNRPSGCKTRWRGGVSSTFSWGAGGMPHPTLSSPTIPYQPSNQTSDSFIVNNMLVIDEFTQEDSLVFQIVLHRIYPPATQSVTIKWGSCCWISGAQGSPSNGNFELTTVAQVSTGNRDPVFNSAIRINGCVGQPFRHDLNPSDPDRDPFRVTIIPTAGTTGADKQVPPLTVSPAGVINWATPRSGNWVVRVLAEDLNANGTTKGASTIRDFLLNVTAVCTNLPPVITLTPDNASVKPGQPACTNVLVTDPNGHKVTVRVSPTKVGVVVTPVNALNTSQTSPFSFRYCWTPAPGDEGTTHNIQFSATDDGPTPLTSQKTFKVTVGQGTPPTVTIGPVGDSKTVDEEKCIKFTATAADVDGPIKEFNVTKPAFCTATRVSTTVFELECCPKYDDDGDHANGSKVYDIEFEVKDRDGTQKTTKRTVKLTVNDVNRHPAVTNPGPQMLDEKKPFKLTVKATDPDGDTLTYAMTGLPTGATIDPATGEISWTPTANDIGDHTATVTVTDGKGGKAEITIKFTVKDINDPPVFTSTPPTVAYVGEDIGYTAVATDPDPNDKLTYSLKKGPAGASVDPQTGKLTWTPDKADAGKTVDIEIEVCDDGTPQACTTQTIKVRVDLRCKVDEDCPTTQICIVSSIGGPKVCVDPGCADKSPKCQTSTDFCKDGKCDKNPCDGKTCGTDEYCNPTTGNCVKPCQGVTCQSDEKCVFGTCVKDPCATAGATGGPCAADEICDATTDPQKPTCVQNPCGTKSCRHGRVCLEDACIDDPCANIKCPDPAKQRCLAGQCVDRKPCAIDIDCDGDEVCIGKQCYPPACYTTTPKCPNANEQCLSATCKKDECTSGDKKCQTDELCRPFDNKCIKSCAGVSCAAGEKCVDGACTKDPCATLKCPAGEVCNPDDTGVGKCEKDNCNASNVCRHGRICATSQNQCADDPCVGLKCPGKSVCSEGQCVPPPQCQFDNDCPGELLCVSGKCITPTCKANGDCKADQLCEDGQCKDDPCKDKTCPDGQICKAGQCIGSCAGIFCPTGETCIHGSCTKDPCAGVKCDAGKICQNGTCVDDLCSKETDPCKQGRLCSVDKCVHDPCNAIKCPAGQVCKDGQCTGDLPCKTDSECPEGGVCIGSKCGPASCYKEQCEGAKICLKAQCGDNACDSNTCGDDEFCKPTDGSCVKVCPTCKDGERCTKGSCEADPCADKKCADGESCKDGTCTADVCAEKDANTTYCRYGRVCNSNACEDDPCANVKCADGQTCKAGICTGPPVQNEVVAEPAPEPIVEVDAGNNPEPAARDFSAAGGLGCAGCSTAAGPLGNGIIFFGFMLFLFLGITRRKSA